jgi:hypothetical protein
MRQRREMTVKGNVRRILNKPRADRHAQDNRRVLAVPACVPDLTVD